MTRLPRWALVLSSLILLACAQGLSAEAKPVNEGRALSFVEHLTAGASSRETLPLIVLIHGLGDTPEAFLDVLSDLSIKARIIAPRAPDPWGEGSSWYPIDDEGQKPRVIRERARLISDLIAQITRTRPTQGKAVVMGFSQGGVLSYALATYHADQLRAALPIAGSLPETLWPTTKASPVSKVIAFHGKADQRITFADGEKTLNALKAQGHEATLRAFNGVGHSIPPAMHAEIHAELRKLLTQGPALLGATAAREEVRSLAAAPKRVAPHGKASIALLARGDNAFLGRLELSPGAKVPEHQDPTEEYIHVLQGRGTLTMNGKAYAIEPGTTIFMPAFANVSYENGDQPFVGIQVFAGPGPADKYQAWKEPEARKSAQRP